MEFFGLLGQGFEKKGSGFFGTLKGFYREGSGDLGLFGTGSV